MTTLASNLANAAYAHADRVAVRVDEATTTYSRLDEASARVAGLLRQRGFKPGDRAGIMLPNVTEFAVVYYGVLRAGGVVVPMNPLLKRREVAYYLGDSGAGLIFAWHGFHRGGPPPRSARGKRDGLREAAGRIGRPGCLPGAPRGVFDSEADSRGHGDEDTQDRRIACPADDELSGLRHGEEVEQQRTRDRLEHGRNEAADQRDHDHGQHEGEHADGRAPATPGGEEERKEQR